jgi:alkylated DNA repair protein alkB family protein 7
MRVLRPFLRSPRRIHTTSGLDTVHRLTEPSSWIRPIPAGSLDGTATQDNTLRDDFLLWPGFFSLEESRQLLAMALWKLDRADSTRRRRRKGGTGTTASGQGDGDGGEGGLQDLFHGEYGFEEVSRGAG